METRPCFLGYAAPGRSAIVVRPGISIKVAWLACSDCEDVPGYECAPAKALGNRAPASRFARHFTEQSAMPWPPPSGVRSGPLSLV